LKSTIKYSDGYRPYEYSLNLVSESIKRRHSDYMRYRLKSIIRHIYPNGKEKFGTGRHIEFLYFIFAKKELEKDYQEYYCSSCFEIISEFSVDDIYHYVYNLTTRDIMPEILFTRKHGYVISNIYHMEQIFTHHMEKIFYDIKPIFIPPISKQITTNI